jgi:hypothetical protein
MITLMVQIFHDYFKYFVILAAYNRFKPNSTQFFDFVVLKSPTIYVCHIVTVIFGVIGTPSEEDIGGIQVSGKNSLPFR